MVEGRFGATGGRVLRATNDNGVGGLFARTVCMLALTLLASGAGADAEAGRLHILIPGGAGGGWDNTARAVGEALRRSELLERVSYENRSGGGGGVAIAHFLETAARQEDAVIIGSSALVVRSLYGLLPPGFEDLVPVACVVADYGALVVRADSPLDGFAALSDAAARDPRSVKVAGGSARGGMDHLVVELVMAAAGHVPGNVVYVAYDAGGQALTSLLSGETPVLSTGVSEVINAHAQGQVRILAITAPARLPELPDVPTFRELGVDAEFSNWRGFFGPPGMTPAERRRVAELLATMMTTREWEVQRTRLALTNFPRYGAEFDEFLALNRARIGGLIETLHGGPGAARR